jgi:hypothetical protein
MLKSDKADRHSPMFPIRGRTCLYDSRDKSSGSTSQNVLKMQDMKREVHQNYNILWELNVPRQPQAGSEGQ